MKKFLSLAALLVLIAPNAFASKARLISLGQDPNGSSYIDDTRSVFLNPAFINTVGDFANFEFGSRSASATPPNAEGGFFHKWNNLHVGLELGRQTDLNDAIAEGNALLGGNNFDNPQNTIEVQLGMGDSYKWGASFIYGMTEDRVTSGVEKKASTYELRGGVMHNAWNAYVALDMLGSSEYNNGAGVYNKLTQGPSFKLGGAYDFDAEQNFFVTSKFLNFKTNNGNGDSAQSVSNVNLGYAHFLNPEAITHFFYSLSLAWMNDNTSHLKTTSLPLVVGLETAATDWLKLRGSVAQNVIIDQRVSAVTNTNNPNSTTVSGGVGIIWKKVAIDATLAGTNAGVNSTGSGNINGNELLANASMTYIF